MIQSTINGHHICDGCVRAASQAGAPVAHCDSCTVVGLSHAADCPELGKAIA